MTWKCAVVNTLYGGAEGGVVVDPKVLSVGELERLTRRYTTEIAALIEPEQDIPAPTCASAETIGQRATAAHSFQEWYQDRDSKQHRAQRRNGMAVVIYLTNGQRAELLSAVTASVQDTDHGHVLVCTDAQGREVGRFRWSEIIGCSTHPDADPESAIRTLLQQMSKNDVYTLVERLSRELYRRIR